jgi:hypothetical protein
MSSLQNISSRAPAAVMAGGAALAAGGVAQLFNTHPADQAELVDLGDYLVLAFFALGLLLVSPGFLALADYARSRNGAIAAAAGTLALGLTCVTSLAHGSDYGFFVVVAPLTNGLWLFGSIALAVSLRRAGRVPKAVYIGLPLVWVATIPLSPLGMGVLAGAYWIAIGYLLSTSGLRRQAPVTPVTA